MRRYIFNLSLAGIASLVLAPFLSGSALAATAANANSALGINLVNVNYYTQEQPFLNIFLTTWISKSNSQGWLTARGNNAANTGEGAYVQTDANGYPTTLTPSSGTPTLLRLPA